MTHTFSTGLELRYTPTLARVVFIKYLSNGDCECRDRDDKTINCPPELLELWADVIRDEQARADKARDQHDFVDS